MKTLYDSKIHNGYTFFTSFNDEEYKTKYKTNDEEFWRKYVVHDENTYNTYLEVKGYLDEAFEKKGLDINEIKGYPKIDLTKPLNEIKQQIENTADTIKELLNYTSKIAVDYSPYSLIPWDSLRNENSIEEIKEEIKRSVVNFSIYISKLYKREISVQEFENLASKCVNKYIFNTLYFGYICKYEQLITELRKMNSYIKEYNSFIKEYTNAEMNAINKQNESDALKIILVSLSNNYDAALSSVRMHCNDETLEQYYNARKKYELALDAYKQSIIIAKTETNLLDDYSKKMQEKEMLYREMQAKYEDLEKHLQLQFVKDVLEEETEDVGSSHIVRK